MKSAANSSETPNKYLIFELKGIYARCDFAILETRDLAAKLVRLLHDLFPDSVHVRDVALKAANDPVVWKYAPSA
jgi:hypothetical protein